MADLVPLRVRIGLRTVDAKRLQHDYPDFNSLVTVQRSGMDWSNYIDQFGGWHYDKCCGHSVERPGSPLGVQYGCLLVPQEFATEALALFGPSGTARAGLVEEVDEATFESFHDNHAHAHEEDEILNLDILLAIKTRMELEVLGAAPPPSDRIRELRRRRLNPKDPLPGITENPNRYWSRRKADSGLSIVPRLRKP